VKSFKLLMTIARYALTAAMVLACFWLFGLWQFARLIPEGSSPSASQNNTTHYDAIIALTGGKDRIPYALDLLKENKANALFITGVADGFSFDDLSMINNAPEGSVLASLRPRIFYGEHARDTIGNAEETVEWLKGTPYRTLLIVTANYHIPRTRLLFSHYLADYQLSYAPVAPPQFERVAWVTHPNSLRLMISEYNKLLLTWVRFGIITR
jgi:uncharacterized SAM-binding protein YcdF (DUF218 family)